MSKQKFIITGGQGFIGTNLTLRLSKIPNTHIISIDSCISKSKNKKYTHDFVEHHEIDLKNISLISEIIKDANCIIHLAAKGNVIESIKEPLANLESNVISTVCLLEAMKISNVKNIIFSSTGGALMGNANPPVNEYSLPSPISPYGASKLSCEGYLSSYSNACEINSIILRFGNVYGKYSSHKIGVVNKWIRSVIENKEILIYGDGTSTRDYIHVDDICHGIELSIKKILKYEQNGIKKTYHLANNNEITLNKLAKLIELISNKKTNIKYLSSRIGEVYRNCSDFRLAKKDIGFNPVITFEKGLRELYAWILKEEYEGQT